MSKYRKTIAAFVAWLALLPPALTDGTLSDAEKVTLAVGLIGVVAVFFTPNTPPT